MTKAKNDHDDGGNDTVIDAEIIAEQESEGLKADMAAEVKSVKSREPSKKPSRAGWIIAFILAAFIGGLIAAPFARVGLEDLGILSPAPTLVATGFPDIGDTSVITDLNAQTADMAAKILQQQEMIAALTVRLEAMTAESTQLRSDLSLLATTNVGSTSTQIDNVSLAAVKADIDRITSDVAQLKALAGDTNPEVAALTGSLALARAETSQLKAKIDAVETVIEGLQAGALAATPRGRMLVVLGRIKEQAQAGLAFGADLSALRLDIAELPALDQQLVGADFATLSQHADGVVSFEMLHQRFGDAARTIKLEQEKETGGLLANLFTVRRTDDGATGIDAVLLEAEKRLTVRDVAGAITALSGLEGRAGTAATAWVSSAQAYHDTMAALDRVMRAVAGPAPLVGAGDRS